jgi:MSHA biogenesis protein MshI
LLKKSAVSGLLGIEIGSSGIAVAHVNQLKQGRPTIQSCRFLHSDENNQPPLAEYIDELGLVGAHCNVVLPNSNYNLILAEAPEVEDAELTDAMRWKIKDLIDFPIEEAVLDAFRLPDDASRGSTRMAYVVVAKKTEVEVVIELIESSGVQLDSIDIAELALRNFSLLLPDDTSAESVRSEGLSIQSDTVSDASDLAIVQLTAGMGNLNIIKNHQLYLSRRFEIDWEAMLLDPLPINSLALELQRSFDYYERQMGQAPPGTVYLCGEAVSQEKLPPENNANLPGTLKVLPLAELLDLPEGAEELSITNCIGAIGGALRDMAVT